MCGIIGIAQKDPSIVESLLTALERMEYRGYDSSGIAIDQEGQIVRYRAVGPLSQLRKKVPLTLKSKTGIGHTRWATHGAPCEKNAHPHVSHQVALVHNGIIENFEALKSDLISKGFEFESETDTEVIAHLIQWHYQRSHNPKEAFHQALLELKGNFSLVCMFSDQPGLLFMARYGSCPLLVGMGEKKHVISSDALGCIDLAKKIVYLEDRTWGVASWDKVDFWTFEGDVRHLVPQDHPFPSFSFERGPYEHHMLKEIYEQTEMVKKLSQQDFKPLEAYGQFSHLTILGCGSSYYAGAIGKYFIEKKIPVTLELASEFHYRNPPMIPGVTLALSQSGETADTLKAANYAQKKHQKIISLVNVPSSSLARLSDAVIDLQAGPELGVASTKSFMAQLWALFSLAGLSSELKDVPQIFENTLLLLPQIQTLAKEFSSHQSLIFLGRGPCYPLAMEGALKVKELAYIHAEGIAAGELKHGPIALMDAHLPVLALAPYDPAFFEKTLSNLYEIAARRAPLFVITDPQGLKRMGSVSWQTLIMPQTTPVVQPFVLTLILQLLAYYTALQKNCAIDKPRNLAKSVTVE